MAEWLAELVLPMLNDRDRIVLSGLTPNLFEEERRTRRKLDLSQTTDSQIEPLLSRYKNLRVLTMRRVDASNADAIGRHCSNLIFLYARARISTLGPLFCLGRLRNLHLYKSCVSGANFTDAAVRLPFLRSVRLEMCCRLDAQDVVQFLHAVQNLRHLAVKNCQLLYDGDKWLNCDAIRNLITLRLEGVRFSTPLMFESPPRIRSLLIDCSSLSNDALEEIPAAFPKLSSLEITKDFAMHRETLATILCNLSNLTSLRVPSVLSLFDTVEDADEIDDMTNALSGLERLEISCMAPWTTADLLPVRRLRSLQTLVLRFDDGDVSEDNVTEISKATRNIPHLVLNDVPAPATKMCKGMSNSRKRRGKTTDVFASLF